MVSQKNQSLDSVNRVQAVSWRENRLVLLDQTALPKIEKYLEFISTDSVIEAIKNLVVRGAPAIGIAGAYAVVLAAIEVQCLEGSVRREQLRNKLKAIQMARPTAVNLSWAIERLQRIVEEWKGLLDSNFVEKLLMEAKQIHQEDLENNSEIAQLGGQLMDEGAILTICNTGDLATGGIGTAFGVLSCGFRAGKVTKVYACETRPVLQGIRLTSWELSRQKIPYQIICDSMAAALMQREKISAVITGADRIAANGDVANKIGTYGLAVIARAHNVPFYVAAPTSSFDLSLESGQLIPIEERHHEEVLTVLGVNRPNYDIPVWNPAFDLTPHSLISAIICERGVINFPNEEKIKKTLTRNES